MESPIAFCGLDCSNCPIHFATLEENPDVKARMRIEIAEMLAKIYHSYLKPEIIRDCDGCKTIDGRLFSGCATCGIRQCALNNKLLNCAYCSNYPCHKLDEHYVHDPKAKTRLDEIWSKLNLKD